MHGLSRLPDFLAHHSSVYVPYPLLFSLIQLALSRIDSIYLCQDEVANLPELEVVALTIDMQHTRRIHQH